MSGAKLAVVHSHSEVPIAALALLATFAAGLGAGLNLPRLAVAEGLTTGTGTIKPARRALYGRQAFKGVADKNKSDSARAAMYDRMRASQGG